MSFIATAKAAWTGWSIGWPIFKKAKAGFKSWNAKRLEEKPAKKARKEAKREARRLKRATKKAARKAGA